MVRWIKSNFLKGFDELKQGRDTIYHKGNMQISLYPNTVRKKGKLVWGNMFVVQILKGGKVVRLGGKRIKYFIKRVNAKKFIKDWVIKNEER